MTLKSTFIKRFSLIILITMQSTATTVIANTKLPQELTVVTKKYSTSKAMTARFEQIIHNASLDSEEKSEGRIY